MVIEDLKSEALRINLETTRVDVYIDPKFEAMRTVLLDYVGLLQQTDNLLAELSHPYRNWNFVVREMRRYALQNFPIYVTHSQGPQVCRLMAEVFMEAIRDGNQPAVQSQAANNLIVFLEHMAREAETLPKEYAGVLSEIFVQMVNMGDKEFFFFASSFYSLKKIGAFLSVSQQTGLDFASYCSLLKKALRTTYQYWLGQEDPRQWFQEQASDWWRGDTHMQYFHPVGHERLRALNEKVVKVTNRAANGDLAKALAEYSVSMATVHASTSSQQVLDHLPKAGAKDLRKNRSIFNNIILTSTGAAEALAQVLPEMRQIPFIAESVRIPVSTGSLIILVVNLQEVVDKPWVDREQINDIYRRYAARMPRGYLRYTEEQNVSSDIIGFYQVAATIEGHETHTRTATITFDLSQLLPMEVLKKIPETWVEVPITKAVIYGWYDNELGSYSNLLGDRLVTMAELMYSQ